MNKRQKTNHHPPSSTVASFKKKKLTDSQLATKHLPLTLTRLNLSRNHLTHRSTPLLLPLISLISLNISENQINDHHLETLFQSITSFPNLTELNLSQNLISNIGAIHILAIRLLHNPIPHLNLRGNQIGDTGAIAISTAFAQTPITATCPSDTILSVNLARNNITCPGCEILLNLLSVSLHHFIITLNGNPGYENNIDFQQRHHTTSIQLQVQHMQHLSYLDLKNCQIQDSQLLPILNLRSIHCNCTTSSINLNNNQVTSFGITSIINWIQDVHNQKSMLSFKLKNISLSGNPGAGTAAHQRLIGVLAVLYLSRLEHGGQGTVFRSIADRGLNDSSIEPISQFLISNPKGQTLIELGMHQNNISQKGCKSLCVALLNHSHLTDLSVYSNTPGIFWGIEMSNVLKTNNVLRVLDMGGCGVGNVGAVALAKVLQQATKTKETKEITEQNEMGGTVEIDETESNGNIDGNCTLTDLHLDHCDIGDVGIQALSKALNTNTTLTNLWLHGNVGMENDQNSYVIQLKKSLERNRTLHMANRMLRCPLLSRKEMFENILERGKKSILLKNNNDQNSVSLIPSFLIQNKNELGASIAEASMAAYHRLCPRHVASWRGGQTVLSTIVITCEEEEEIQGTSSSSNNTSLCHGFVVALGVGTKFLTPEVVLSSTHPNDVVRDSHAEVLARRCFVRYLHTQLALVMSQENQNINSIFEQIPLNEEIINNKSNTELNSNLDTSKKNEQTETSKKMPLYRLKKNFQIHLYTSLAPCGAASIANIDINNDKKKEGGAILLAKRGAPDTSTNTSTNTNTNTNTKTDTNSHEKTITTSTNASSSSSSSSSSSLLAGGFECMSCSSDVVGNTSRRLSCTDKICRWISLGLQGGRLSSMILNASNSLSPNTIVIGRRYDAERCSKALSRGNTNVIHGGKLVSRTNDEKTQLSELSVLSTRSLEGMHLSSSAVFGGTTGRSMGGDGDECLTWSAGDATVARHDGRTGLPMIPSCEVLKRLGEKSIVSTTEMTKEFNSLLWWNTTQRKETNRDADEATHTSSPTKSDIASEEWLRLRLELYE